MHCCKRNRRKIFVSLLEKKLESINQIYPGTHFTCMINSIGEPVAKCNVSNKIEDEEAMAIIASLKQGAIQFTAALKQSDCSVIHIKGETHIFSCYDIDSYLLAFYSNMSRTEITAFDTKLADKLLQPLIEELHQLIQEIY